MSKKDRDHFSQYRDQTRVKHEILRKYIPSFFHILKNYQDNLLYIDGFAGRGTYEVNDSSRADGSPLHALKIISENDKLSKKVSTIFIENDSENYRILVSEINNFYKKNKHIRKPEHQKGKFSNCINKLLDDLEKKRSGLAPCFVFVDPCGIEGASMKTIKRLLSQESCEAFIFFNIDGVRRVCGLKDMSTSLEELYGSSECANSLLSEVQKSRSPLEKEKTMLLSYMNALKDDTRDYLYITPFSVEHEKRKVTSHYLIHVTKHKLGFKIMKDVMWLMGSNEEGKGNLGLVQASKYSGDPLFRLNWDSFKESILNRLLNGPLKIRVIYEDWVMSPEDVYSEPAYREALLELEKEQKICILDKNRRDPKPAEKRVKRLGKTTLGKDYYVTTRS